VTRDIERPSGSLNEINASSMSTLFYFIFFYFLPFLSLFNFLFVMVKRVGRWKRIIDFQVLRLVCVQSG
jgi:hypothetical protein